MEESANESQAESGMGTAPDQLAYPGDQTDAAGNDSGQGWQANWPDAEPPY
jgi:hypothetical protein